jgi:hypothetical protein
MPGLDSRGLGIPAALLLLLLTPAAVAVLPIHCGNDSGNASGIGEMQECDTQGGPKLSRCRCSSSASSAAFAWLLLAMHAAVARAPAGAEHSQQMYQLDVTVRLKAAAPDLATIDAVARTTVQDLQRMPGLCK